MTHLLLKGNNVTVPICGDTTIGKKATYFKKSVTCETCLATLEQLLTAETYASAESALPTATDETTLEKHGIPSKATLTEATIGTPEEFWSNVERLEV